MNWHGRNPINWSGCYLADFSWKVNPVKINPGRQIVTLHGRLIAFLRPSLRYIYTAHALCYIEFFGQLSLRLLFRYFILPC